MNFFSRRRELVEEYQQWLAEKSIKFEHQLEDSAFNVITFLAVKDYLKDDYNAIKSKDDS